MSKIESGKLTLTTEQISLKEVVEGIVNIMQPQVKTKSKPLTSMLKIFLQKTYGATAYA